MIEKHSLIIKDGTVWRDGIFLKQFENEVGKDFSTSLYREFCPAYPKFFKMDSLSRLGFVAVELLMQVVEEDFNKEKVALILTTDDGCLEVDERFEESRQTLASPALFVYTLPNIVAGEICIRNGFKGEQMLFVASEMDKEFNKIYLRSLFSKGHTEAAIVGFLNAYQDKIECNLTWITK